MGTERPFKRSLLGYRPREVDEAIAAHEAAFDAIAKELIVAERRLDEREAEVVAQVDALARRQTRIRDLEQVATRLCERLVVRDSELAEAREELARMREQGEGEMRSLAALGEELVQVRRQARGQATRIRLRALRDAAELGERISELAHRPAVMRERLLDSLQLAIERIGGAADEAVEAVAAAAETNGYVPDRDPGEVFEGMVEVDIGPLSDFSQLVGFEDAAGGIGATSEICVRRFARGRATLEMKLAEPVELLHELEERTPFEFRVRDTRSDRLILDVDDEGREAA